MENGTELFVVVREGVYWNRLIGVFTTLARAKWFAEETIRLEPDDHHRMIVVRTCLNVRADDEILARLHPAGKWEEPATDGRAKMEADALWGAGK